MAKSEEKSARSTRRSIADKGCTLPTRPSALVKELSTVKFDESVDVPSTWASTPEIGPGRAWLDGSAERHRQDVRVAVFAQGEKAEAAKRRRRQGRGHGGPRRRGQERQDRTSTSWSRRRT